MSEDFTQHRLQEPIGILGYGVEGKSTSEFLLRQGYANLVVFDRQAPHELSPKLRYFDGVLSKGNYLSGITEMKTVFRSAGIRPDLPELLAFQKQGGILTSQIEWVMELVGPHRIIGVTGTLGKGTCCSMLEAMLQESAIPHKLGGNIGVPALDLLEGLSSEHKLILELSSFQLSTLHKSPAYAAVLKTTSEHLDWHLSKDEYWLHKANLVATQNENNFLTYYADAPGSKWIAMQTKARKVAFGKNAEIEITAASLTWKKVGLFLPLKNTRLTGEFNLENLAAAGALALELGATPTAVLAGAENFSGLEHRLEFVKKIGEVSFYNDSYATRPEAAMGAIAAFKKSQMGLILGGSDKFADFSELAKTVVASLHVVAVALIGQTAERLEKELVAAGWKSEGSRSLKHCKTLEESLAYLIGKVKLGAVVLSPACASFGMFENYKERGKSFKRLVMGL